MSIFDKIFSKKEEEEKSKKLKDKKDKKEKEKPTRLLDRKKKMKGKEKKSEPVKEVSKKASQPSVLGEKAKKISKKEKNMAYRILTEPVVTEKSINLGQFNKYIFKVNPKAGKHQIREAIQNYYGVRVEKVHTIKIHPKKRIQGRTIGYKKGYKKAIITLAAGDTIGVNESV
jgi:large subunit ribosomal protein L23